jgi:ABC-type branched-subunit amino acid transport system substrate-binding protein
MPAHKRWPAQTVYCLIASLLVLFLPSCVRTTPRIVKIGLVAPFEGRYREIGYDVIPAARLAIREWASQAGAFGIAVELVAYDDMGDPEMAVDQARRIIADPQVAIVIGHWRDETTQAALPVYAEAGLPMITFSIQPINSPAGVYNLSPSADQLHTAAEQWAVSQASPVTLWLDNPEDVTADLEQLDNPFTGKLVGGPVWGLSQFYALSGGRAEGICYVTGAALPHDVTSSYWTPERVSQFVAGYEDGSFGAPPGPLAIGAYQAAWLAITQALQREGIQVGETPADTLQFDASGRQVDAPIYLYTWENGQRHLITQLH